MTALSVWQENLNQGKATQKVVVVGEQQGCHVEVRKDDEGVGEENAD
jgi:hypothetical protein